MIFRVSFSYFEMFYVVVLQFGIFPGRFEWINELMQSESFWGRLNDQNIARSKSRFWWHMSVIQYEFTRFLFIHYKIDLVSFYSSNIGYRIRIWTLETLSLSINNRIIQKIIIHDTVCSIEKFVRFYSSTIKSIREASIIAKLVIEFEFEY